MKGLAEIHLRFEHCTITIVQDQVTAMIQYRLDMKNLVVGSVFY